VANEVRRRVGEELAEAAERAHPRGTLGSEIRKRCGLPPRRHVVVPREVPVGCPWVYVGRRVRIAEDDGTHWVGVVVRPRPGAALVIREVPGEAERIDGEEAARARGATEVG